LKTYQWSKVNDKEDSRIWIPLNQK